MVSLEFDSWKTMAEWIIHELLVKFIRVHDEKEWGSLDPVMGIVIAVAIGGFWTSLGYYLGSREIRQGLSEISKGFDKMDERFMKMDERFVKMDERFARMDKRFERMFKESSESHTKILEAIRELTRR